MLGEIKKGDRLRLTIRDCYVESVSVTSRGRFLHVNFRDQGSNLNVGPLPIEADLLEVEALTPYSWPPLQSDVWEDGKGKKWFGVCPIGENRVTLISERGRYPADGLDDLARTNGPWRLIYRDENAPPF